MADKKISEMATASVIDNEDNLELSHSVNSSFTSVKASILAIATKMLTAINFTSALQTTNKTVIGAINEVAQGGGGSSTFAGLSDVDIDDTTLANGQVPKWNSTTEKWENGNAGGGSGGHTILDDSGTSLAQEDDLQFKGTYSHDDSTNGKTVVEITREMTQAEYDLLSADEKKGIIRITDDNYVCDGTEVKYSTGVSVKDKIDSMVEVLTLTKGSKINNVANVKAKVLDNATLVISGVAYVNATINADEEILDLGKSFSQNFSFAYSLADGVRAIKVDGTKLKANVNIASGNLYFSASINI